MGIRLPAGVLHASYQFMAYCDAPTKIRIPQKLATRTLPYSGNVWRIAELKETGKIKFVAN